MASLAGFVYIDANGDGLRGEHGRVPVRRPGHEQAESDARRLACERGERGHPLEGLTGPVAVHGLEVVEPPGTVEAEVLGEADAADQLVP